MTPAARALPCVALVLSGCASAPSLPAAAPDHLLVAIMETFCAGRGADAALARAVALRKDQAVLGRLGTYDYSQSLSPHAINVRTSDGGSAEVMYVEDASGRLSQCFVELGSQPGVDVSVGGVNASMHAWATLQAPPLRRTRDRALEHGQHWSNWTSDSQAIQVRVSPPSPSGYATVSLSWIPLCGGHICD